MEKGERRKEIIPRKHNLLSFSRAAKKVLFQNEDGCTLNAKYTVRKNFKF